MRLAIVRLAVAGAVAGAVLGVSGVAWGADTSALGPVSLRGTIVSIGVEAALEGDDDGDATLALSYREVGAASFVEGHALLRAGARGLGSVLFLAPDTAYEVRVTLEDPDNAAPVEVVETVTTRADAPVPATGTTLYVDASAAAGGDGTSAAPFATIQAAVDAASPGDTIRVAAGVYREAVVVDRGGTATAPLYLVADEGAILDGGDAALEDGSAFIDEGGGVWSAPFTGECRYAAVDDTRIYDFASLAELEAGLAGVDGGYFVDASAGRIYLRLPGDAAPAGHAIHVARLGVGILLDTVTDVVVEGFEIRHYGAAEYSGVGVDVRDTARAWVRSNVIHHMNTGVRIRRSLAADTVVEGNTVRDTSVWTWPWDAVKAHTAEASAISIEDGSGHVVRRNTLSGTFNGVYVGNFDDPAETFGRDTDIYENVLAEHGDDAFEPEGASVNVRFFNNAIHSAHNGVSLAPIVVGPLFVVRNLIAGYKAHALKVNNGPQGWMLVYHNTTAPAADLGEAQAFSPSEPFQHLVTRNNVWASHRYVIESSVTPSGPVDLDYDCLYTDLYDGTARFVKWLDVRYDDLAALQASNTIEAHGFAVTPEYEDAAGWDYTPVAESALLDVGLPLPGINDLTTVGAGPDLGAFERGGTTPPIDPGIPGSTGGTGAAGNDGGGPGSGAAGSGLGGTSDGGASASGAEGGGDDGGCGCRTAPRSPSAWLALGALAAAVALRRVRRRPAR